MPALLWTLAQTSDTWRKLFSQPLKKYCTYFNLKPNLHRKKKKKVEKLTRNTKQKPNTLEQSILCTYSVFSFMLFSWIWSSILKKCPEIKQFKRHRRLVKALSPQCFGNLKFLSFIVRVLQSSGLSWQNNSPFKPSKGKKSEAREDGCASWSYLEPDKQHALEIKKDINPLLGIYFFTSPLYRLGLQPTSATSWALGLWLDGKLPGLRKSEANRGSFYGQGTDVCRG